MEWRRGELIYGTTLVRSWDNSDWSFGWGLRTPSLGEEEARRSGKVPLERALESSYRPSIVLPSLRVSEILPLLCSSTPLFLTPPLVSSKFFHVPPWVGGWFLGYKERRCWANFPCNLQATSSWSTNVTTHMQTDNGETDDMQSQYRAWCIAR